MRIFLTILTVIISFISIQAQSKPVSSVLTPQERQGTIENVIQMLDKFYIFPDVAQKSIQNIRAKASSGTYDKIENGPQFARELTADLQSSSRDRHLRVEYSAEILPADQPFTFNYSPQQIAEMRKMMSKSNYGIEKIEFLLGNVGYLKINYFAPLAVAADSYSAALNAVAETDALIIDLRNNGGSLSPETIPYVAGYFFETPVHLNDIYWGNEKQTRQYWSAAQVAGRKYTDKPVYILISKETFSGAEEFAYDFKHLKRATIIGETSGGGANPGGMRRLGDHFAMFVPFGKATNPITKTNWEGVGVVPDVATEPAEARCAAQSLALVAIESRAGNHPEWQRYIQQLRSETSKISAKGENPSNCWSVK